MSGQIPTNVILTKQGDQNVVVSTQNMPGTAQGTIVPNVQIVNMRPGTPVTAQKSVATVSPRVVIGTPQVVGARAAAPGITLQTLQGLQAGQQGHLLLKTENGQYQLLRVGPAPGTTSLAGPQTQSIRLTSVPAQNAQTLATTMSTPQQVIAHVGNMGVAAQGSVASTTTAQVQQPVVTTQKPSDNTKEKCRNFLANLLDLSSKEPKAVETNVRNLIQELINAQVEPEQFCDRLEKLLNASPQPCLIGFLKKSLPLLRQSLVSKELVIEGIQPPPAHVAFGGIAQTPLVVTQNVTVQKQVAKPGGKISVLQNIPVQTKLNINKVTAAKGSVVLNKANIRPPMASASLSTIITPKTTLKDKEKKSSSSLASHQFLDDKMAGDDDINDVAAMGGVNLAEESQRILGSTEMIGTQIRSCKDEYLTPMAVMQSRIKAAMTRHGLEEPASDVAALLSHALQERLKTIVEKLAVIAQHRIDLMVKNDARYEVTQDVKSQLKFLEELDRMERKRRDDSERELLLRAAKSRSKTEDPEQAKLKAKAKEMQRAEMEELRQREANLTALQAIGPRKKPRLDGAGGASETATSTSTSNSTTATSGRGQMALRTRLKRINQRDVMFLMEQERETAHSQRLYKYYLK